jgi:hypothetical protein
MAVLIGETSPASHKRNCLQFSILRSRISIRVARGELIFSGSKDGCAYPLRIERLDASGQVPVGGLQLFRCPKMLYLG